MLVGIASSVIVTMLAVAMIVLALLVRARLWPELGVALLSAVPVVSIVVALDYARRTSSALQSGLLLEIPAVYAYLAAGMVAAAMVVWLPTELVRGADGRIAKTFVVVCAATWAGFLYLLLGNPVWEFAGVCLPPGNAYTGVDKFGHVTPLCEFGKSLVLPGVLWLILVLLAALAVRHTLSLSGQRTHRRLLGSRS